MALATLASIAAIAAAGASLASIGYTAAQGTPKAPDAASSSRKVATAKANALPVQRALSAAEQQGGKALRAGYKEANYGQGQIDALNEKLARQQQAYAKIANSTVKGDQATKTQLQASIAKLKTQIAGIPAGGGTVYLNKAGKVVPASEAFADFAGYGTADIEGKLAGQMADIQTELGAKYGEDFARQNAADARLADPLGFQARDLEAQMLKDRKLDINPLAGQLEDQTREQLAANGGLDGMSRDLLDSAVARANADRAGGLNSGDVAQEMATGAEGAARRQAAITKSQALLSSGSTPEAIARRQQQQAIADEASFAAGKTPESQFQNLSAAGQGATPFMPGQQGPTVPGNSGAAGGPYSVSAYEASLHNQGQQANSWLAGIGTALGGVSALAKARG